MPDSSPFAQPPIFPGSNPAREVPSALTGSDPKETALEAMVLEDLAPPAYPSQPYAPHTYRYPMYPGGAWPSPMGHAKEKVYSVPKRFGLSAILAMMTAIAFLFGALRRLDAPPMVYLFLGTLVMVICLVQMFFGAVPRQASVIAGAVLLPLFSFGMAFTTNGADSAEAVCSIIGGIPIGAFVGYLVGACAAGVFLLMDKLEPYLPGGTRMDIPQKDSVFPQPSNAKTVKL